MLDFGISGKLPTLQLTACGYKIAHQDLREHPRNQVSTSFLKKLKAEGM